MVSVKGVIKKIDNLFTKRKKESLVKIDDVNEVKVVNLTKSFKKKVLFKDLNLVFKKNKKYMIEGESGVGKTTLLNLLTSYDDDYEGYIYFDNVNIKDLSKDNINNLVTYCEQSPFLFNANLIDNITIFEENPDLDKVKNIIKKCSLEDFFKKRGNELLDNTLNQISLGEKQRIALVRALYLDKPIILLDEITSSLDYENSLIVSKTIKNIENKIVIIISHKDNELFSYCDEKKKL